MPQFCAFHVFCFVYFQGQNLHLAPFCLSSLLASSYFFRSNYPLLAPKTLLSDHYFALFSHIFHGSKRFCLYHCSGYLCLSPRIWHHFARHFAPFYLAFSTKTHCILHQNALRFAPYCTAFSTKMHFILLQIAKKWVLVAVSLNKNSFCLHVQPSPFCTKTNLRENRFFATRLVIGGKKSTHCVKILTEKLTGFGRSTSRQVNKLTRE